MLRFVLTYSDGREKELKNILSAALNCETDVPADGLALVCRYSRGLAENAEMITAFQGDEKVFTGALDEIISIKQSGEIVQKLTARSLAAGLLDNEAEPLVYYNPSASFIFNRHLKPFGITEYQTDRIPLYGSLRIDKGMSHWQALEAFCRNRYGAEPRISGGGKAFLRGFEKDGEVVFGENGIKYYAITEKRRPHRLISEVKLKMDAVNGYNSSLKNSNKDCKKTVRVRYVNALAENSTLDTARKIIEKSNLDSYYIKLKCAGCHISLLSKSAQIRDGIMGTISGLTVSGAAYSLTKNGEVTALTLRKEKF